MSASVRTVVVLPVPPFWERTAMVMPMGAATIDAPSPARTRARKGLEIARPPAGGLHFPLRPIARPLEEGAVPEETKSEEPPALFAHAGVSPAPAAADGR